MSLIVLGTVALDTLETPFGKKERVLGGSAVHFSLAARLFTDVSLVAVVGEDFPSKHFAFLRSKGVDVNSVQQVAGETFHWSGSYSGDMNTAQTLRTDLGVLATFCPRVSPRQRDIKNVFLANIDPDIQIQFLSSMRRPHLVAADSMNYWISSKRASLCKLLKKIDIYVANDQEARQLSGETNLLKAIRALQAMGPKGVLIKKGEHGVLCLYGREILTMPAFAQSNVVDPTGAGDTFAGGFMGYLSCAKICTPAVMKRALAYGTIAASFNIEQFGVERTAKLTKADLQKRMGVYRKCFSL